MTRRTKPTFPPEPIMVDVKTVTQFAFNTGLTPGAAEDILLATPDEWCGIFVQSCGSATCGANRTRHLVARAAFAGRDVLFCEECGQADLWL